MKYKLIEKKHEIGNIYTFVFEPEKPIAWIPGQYIHYYLDHPNPDERGIERWFTISSSPGEKYISLTTRLEESPSSFKKHLFNLSIGQAIVGDKPEGEFVYRETAKKVFFLAGGIGITPFRAILEDFNQRRKEMPEITLFYANRDHEVVFKNLFDSLAKNHPKLKIEYFLKDKKIDQMLLEKRINNLDKSVIYLSGPKAFFTPIKETLLAMGLPVENLLKDFFPGYNNY